MQSGAMEMILDNFDLEYLKLCGLCRYMPVNIGQHFFSPVLSKGLADNLREHGLIRMQTDGLSHKLTGAGRDVLADMGYEFSKDARMSIKRQGYRRKLVNARWNVLLYLAGIDIFLKSSKELADIETGYISSLILRGNDNIRVLAGTRFNGLLRLRGTVYVPYHVEGTDDWIIPGHEKDVFTSQASLLHGVKRVRIILFSETLEELWTYTHPEHKPEPLTYGRKRFESALEEMGCQALMIPLDFNGVTQVKVLSVRGYGKKIARAVGCRADVPEKYSRCDGILEGIPLVTAIDMNAERIRSALCQIRLSDPKVAPIVVCLPFQRDMLLKILEYYGCQECMVSTLRDDDLIKVFPELVPEPSAKRPIISKEGKYIYV